MSLAIRGLDTALPANRLPQMELAEAARKVCAENDEQRATADKCTAAVRGAGVRAVARGGRSIVPVMEDRRRV
jgi:hypothetical protein